MSVWKFSLNFKGCELYNAQDQSMSVFISASVNKVRLGKWWLSDYGWELVTERLFSVLDDEVPCVFGSFAIYV